MGPAVGRKPDEGATDAFDRAHRNVGPEGRPREIQWAGRCTMRTARLLYQGIRWQDVC